MVPLARPMSEADRPYWMEDPVERMHRMHLPAEATFISPGVQGIILPPPLPHPLPAVGPPRDDDDAASRAEDHGARSESTAVDACDNPIPNPGALKAAEDRLCEAGFDVTGVTASIGRARSELAGADEHVKEREAALRGQLCPARERLEAARARRMHYDKALTWLTDARDDVGVPGDTDMGPLEDNVAAFDGLRVANAAVIEEAGALAAAIEAELAVVEGLAETARVGETKVPTCCICYEKPVSCVALCGHTFCGDCVDRMRGGECYVCKRPCRDAIRMFFC